MKKIITEGLIIAACLLGAATTGFAIPLSFTLSGTIGEGVVWDLDTTDRSRSHSVANNISGLDFTMTLTRLPSAPFLNFYGFNVEMEVPGYSFGQPGEVFYSLDATMKVLETGTPGGAVYRFSYWGLGDHIFNVILGSDGIGRIDWAAIGYSLTREQRIGAYRLQDTECNWTTASSDNVVPVPEPGTMLLFCIGATGVAGYKMRKK